MLVSVMTSLSSSNQPTDYWIWAGIRPDNTMKGSILYVYQGHITKQDKRFVFERGGLAPHPLSHDIYLVYRITGALPDSQMLINIFQTATVHWNRHKVRVIGIQLDFDSPTSKLLMYSAFLRDLRGSLPKSYKLSITGLSDWIVFGNRDALQEITKITDEVVFQLYQNSEHFPEMNTYLKKLGQKNIPFKIGLLAHKNPEIYIHQIKAHPHFKGAVLFVQKGRTIQ